MMPLLNWGAPPVLPLALQTIRADDLTYHHGTQAFTAELSCFAVSAAVAGSAVAMSTDEPLAEFRAAWLPHVTDVGLNRIVELLEKASPLLIHGTFTRVPPMGCLASHVGWNHPKTCRFDHEAGVMWLSHVAGLNPATSSVILAWDRSGVGDFELRTALLEACRDEQTERGVRSAERGTQDKSAVAV